MLSFGKVYLGFSISSLPGQITSLKIFNLSCNLVV